MIDSHILLLIDFVNKFCYIRIYHQHSTRICDFIFLFVCRLKCEETNEEEIGNKEKSKTKIKTMHVSWV